MNETLLILCALFGFAVLVEVFSTLYRARQLRRTLQRELHSATQMMIELRQKNEWLELRLEDLLDAAQLQSVDVDREQERLDRLTHAIKNEASQKGYRLGLGDIDEDD